MKLKKPPHKLIVDIYIQNELTITHIFYGKTRAEVDSVFMEHMDFDEFLHGAIRNNEHQSVPLNVRYRYEK